MLVVRPFSAFILAAVLNDAVNLMSARSLDNARMFMVPAEDVRKTMEIDPDFARMMVIELAQGYRSIIRAHLIVLHCGHLNILTIWLNIIQ